MRLIEQNLNMFTPLPPCSKKTTKFTIFFAKHRGIFERQFLEFKKKSLNTGYIKKSLSSR